MKSLKPPTQEKLEKLKSNIRLFYPNAQGSDELLNYLIVKIWEDVLIYIHCDEMPGDLEATVEEMVLDNLQTYRWLDSATEIEDGRIKEISEGDVTIKRLTDEEALKIKASLKGGTISFKYKLNSYRRFKR